MTKLDTTSRAAARTRALPVAPADRAAHRRAGADAGGVQRDRPRLRCILRGMGHHPDADHRAADAEGRHHGIPDPQRQPVGARLVREPVAQLRVYAAGQPVRPAGLVDADGAAGPRAAVRHSRPGRARPAGWRAWRLPARARRPRRHEQHRAAHRTAWPCSLPFSFYFLALRTRRPRWCCAARRCPRPPPPPRRRLAEEPLARCPLPPACRWR